MLEVKSLNVRSFVAVGIVAPIVAGIILLNIEYSFFTPGGSLAKEAEKLVENLEGPIKKSSIEEFVEKDVDILETMYQAASKINVYGKRNNEYVRIIALALEKEKPGFAFRVASEINVYGTRDEQYIKIIDYALSREHLRLALAIAEEIDVYGIRNEQYKKIIDLGFKLDETTSNKAPQPTADIGD